MNKLPRPPHRMPGVGLLAAASRAGRTTFATALAALLVSALSSGACAQSNDAFADAIDLPLATVLNGSNAGATKESGEPDHGGDDGGGSVWWKFTAPVSKKFVVDIPQRDFRPIIGIYTGNAVNALTQVVGYQATFEVPALSFAATAGTTYYIAVDGYNPGHSPHETGSFQIRINRTLIISPETNAEFRGPEGGPFSPSSFTYTLTAPAGPTTVSISNAASWADRDPTGTIAIGPTPVTVTFTPNANANTRTPGSFSGLVLFTSNHSFDPFGTSTTESRYLWLLVRSASDRTLSLAANPDGGGSLAGAGSFAEGSQRTVTATPAAGYRFSKWTEDDATVSNSPSYTFTLADDRSLVAHFVQERTLSVSANPKKGGTVSGGGKFAHGSVRTVTAKAKRGYRFLRWTEGPRRVSGSPRYTFELNSNRSLRATFGRKKK